MRRTGVALLTVAVALGGVVLLLLFFQGRDRSQVGGAGNGGAGVVASGPGRPRSDAELAAALRGAAGAEPTGAELLDALERGNVVLVYGTARPPAALRALAERVAGPSDPALEASGQAVLLARRPGTDGVVALAWRRMLRAPGADDPQLEPFASYWLGRGADG